MYYHEDSSFETKTTIKRIFEKMEGVEDWLEQIAEIAKKADRFGSHEGHAAGTEQRERAILRDNLDFVLDFFAHRVASIALERAETTRCTDLLLDQAGAKKGDGSAFLRLMRHYFELDETGPHPGDVDCEDSLIGDFVWETYERVLQLDELARKYPQLVRFSARKMHGWPMIVSHHLDVSRDFKELFARLDIGGDYPLDVSPRKKRGSETPLLRYLEPMIRSFHVCREVLLGWEKNEWPEEDIASRLPAWWVNWPEVLPGPEVLKILRRLSSLPPMTKQSAARWSREIIVPIIMLEDARDRDTCEIPALLSIWRHRGVKGRGTFKSHLLSAVTSTIRRYSKRA